ncbi:MAG: hypothetical protein PVJ86_14300 [Phycisphaerales bacterium]|jgi:hypothetical protein
MEEAPHLLHHILQSVELIQASFFSGLTDDICIYNVAMGAKEIKELGR